ncbi:uncharacterized, partial [Tachysurus ichikawai]
MILVFQACLLDLGLPLIFVASPLGFSEGVFPCLGTTEEYGLSPGSEEGFTLPDTVSLLWNN